MPTICISPNLEETLYRSFTGQWATSTLAFMKLATERASTCEEFYGADHYLAACLQDQVNHYLGYVNPLITCDFSDLDYTTLAQRVLAWDRPRQQAEAQKSEQWYRTWLETLPE